MVERGKPALTLPNLLISSVRASSSVRSRVPSVSVIGRARLRGKFAGRARGGLLIASQFEFEPRCGRFFSSHLSMIKRAAAFAISWLPCKRFSEVLPFGSWMAKVHWFRSTPWRMLYDTPRYSMAYVGRRGVGPQRDQHAAI